MEPPDLANAEKWAIAGIQLDGKGTVKLWKNLGGSYKLQDRLRESLDAYTKVLLLDPKSKNTKKTIKAIEKVIKNRNKSAKKEKMKKDKKEKEKIDLKTEGKENSLKSLSRTNSKASFFKKHKSEKSIGKVVHC